MSGGDISATLRVNVVVDTAGAEAQIRDAISRINTGNNVIRLRADASDALKEINSLKSEIQSLSKRPISFGVTSAFGKMVNNGFGAASEQLSNINQQIQALSSNGGATKSLTQVSDVVSNLKTEMTSLSQAMDRFQGINIKLGNEKGGFNNTVAYGNAARNTIAELKGQTEQLENFLKTYYNVQDGLEGSLKLLQGTGQTSKFLTLQDSILNPKASLQDQMASLRDYIGLIQEVASSKDIDLSSVTSGFSNEAAKLVEDCNKVATGEKQIADGVEKLKGLFGGSVNGEALSSQLETISSAIQNISQSVATLTSDESPFTGITSSITKATEAVEKLSMAFDKLDGKATGGATGGAGKAGDDFAAGTSSWATKINAATKQIETMETFYNKMNGIPGLASNGTSQLEAYRSAIDSYIELRDSLKSEDGTGREQYNKALVDITERASEAKVALQEAADAQIKMNEAQAASDKEAKANILSKDSAGYKSSVLETTKQIEAMENFYSKMRNTPGLMQSGENELKKYASVLDDMKRLNTDLNNGDMDKGGYIARFTNLAEEASKAKVELQQVANAQAKINTEQAANRLDIGSDAWTTKMNNATKQIQTMEDFYSKMSGIDGIWSSGKEQLEKYRGIIDSFKSLQNELKSGNMSKSDYNSALSNITEQAAKAKAELTGVAEAQKNINTERAASAAKAQADILTKDSAGYKSAMLEVTRQIESMEKYQNKVSGINGLNENGAKELQDYASSLEKIKQLSSDISRGDMKKGDYNSRFTALAKEASRARIELEKVAEAQKKSNAEANKDKMFEEGSAKQANALREISKLQQEIAQNSKRWASAEHGQSSEKYQAYKEQAAALDELREKVENCTISEKEYATESAKIKATMQENASAIASAGENTQGFGAQIGNVVRHFGMYFGMAQVVMKTVQTVKQMVSASIEIESAMNRIQIVTGATDSQMGQFFDSASQQAQQLGQNITDVAKSIETFSRLGYSLSDATDLSKYATIMSNVADTSVDAATTGLTSIIKGFGMEASDAEHVSDVLINVGQKYAISAEELMEAFERGGAAMNASGTSFEQSAALFAATNASLQNASTTG